ncbi:MAG: hypothetical protein G01um101425_405 [Candidatus Peregrinibacteria bacterium Gr01-1014_25]|nr:MAG: hypothetical protein G01um101425_405 [Candidatus Peregrinibacteria bacterium Gr01-1014_25]
MLDLRTLPTLVENGHETNGHSLNTWQFPYRSRARSLLVNGHAESAEAVEAGRFFHEYLLENVAAAKTLLEMEEIVKRFKEYGLIIVEDKCVDGRVHGSKGTGYPIGTVTFMRNEGAKLDIEPTNVRLWEIVHAAVSDAAMKTPGMPAIFRMYGHYSGSDACLGCAAHGYDCAIAEKTVADQTEKLRREYYDPKHINLYTRKDIVFAHGLTNTDDMAERIVFEDHHVLDSSLLIEELRLTDPTDLFSERFLNEPMHNPAFRKYTGDQPMRYIFNGGESRMYRDLGTSLAMQAFLIEKICELVSKEGRGAEEIFNPRSFETLRSRIARIPTIPSSLTGPLLYQFVWNIAYVLYQRKRLGQMGDEEKKLHLDHAEKLVCYGEGFESLARNTALLVSPGRGNEMHALTKAKDVLGAHSPYKHLPMVHINIELTDEPGSWDSFNRNVLSKLMRMKGNVNEIFGKGVSILCTYSYRDEKQFYPVRIDARDVRECVHASVTDGFSSESNFTANDMNVAQSLYTQTMRKELAA